MIPIPHAKWRETQTELGNLRRQIQAQETEYRTKLATQGTELSELQKVKADYEALGEMLDEHPELAAAFEEVVRGRAATRPSRPAAPAAPALPEKYLKTIDGMAAFLAEQKQREQQAAVTEADRRTGHQLDQVITQHLAGWKYDPKFLPQARQYVLAAIRAGVIPNPTMEDVPYLLSQWYEGMEDFYTTRVNGMRDGKTQDAALPTTPGPTSAAVAPGPEKGDAFGPKTENRLLEAVQRLGWNNGGAV